MVSFNKLRTDKTLNERFVRIKDSNDETGENNGANLDLSLNQVVEMNKENVEPMDDNSYSGQTTDNIMRQLAQNFKRRRSQRQTLEEKKIFRSNVGHNRGLDVSFRPIHGFRPTHSFRPKLPVPTKLELDIDIDLYMSGAMDDLQQVTQSIE